MRTLERIALLTDDEARACLNGVLKGRTARDEVLDSAVRDENALKRLIAEVSHGVGVPTGPVAEPSGHVQNRAARFVLVQYATGPQAADLDAWLDSKREKLLEPVTAALVLAGLVLVLSADISITYELKDGKRHLKVEIRKAETPADILKKFFGLFGGG